MGTILAVAALIEYYRAVLFFMKGGRLAECPSFKNDEQAKVNLFSLAAVFQLWNTMDHNSQPLHQSLRIRLKHITLPWTGLPLSWWLISRPMYVVFVLAAFPMMCLFAAISKSGLLGLLGAPAEFREQLEHSSHWLISWLNGYILVAHAASPTTKSTFLLEDQVTFLNTARGKKLSAIGSLEGSNIVVKNANVEGGMGIFFFKNIESGGDWAFQEIPLPHKALQEVIPLHYGAPRFHVVTMLPFRNDEEKDKSVKTLSVVLQVLPPVASGTPVDHSMYFDVSPFSCTIENGSTHTRWYNKGPIAALRYDLGQSGLPITRVEGKIVIGTNVPEVSAVMELAHKSHSLLGAGIPLASWTIQLTDEGAVLERVSFQASNWSSFTDYKLFYRTVCEWTNHYQAKPSRRREDQL